MNEVLSSVVSQKAWFVSGWLILHYLWVGALIGVVAWCSRGLLHFFAGRRGANLRYVIASLWLLLLAITPVPLACWIVRTHQMPSTRQLVISAADVPAVIELTEQEPNRSMPLELSAGSKRGEPAWSGEDGLHTSASSWAMTAWSWPESLDVMPWLRRLPEYLPWVWLVGAPVTFLLLMLGVVGAERLRRGSDAIVSGRLPQSVKRMAAALGLRREVGVAVSERIRSPILVGVLRPLILLPPAAISGWTPEQVELMLLHELAHVRRWDNLVNLLQRLLESVLYFQPAVWFVSAWMRREREHCCDELVLSVSGKAELYVQTLAAVALEQVTRGQLGVSLAISSSATSAMARRHVLSRIRYILKREDEKMHVSTKAVTAIGGVFLASVLISGWIAEPQVAAQLEGSQRAERDRSATPGNEPAAAPARDGLAADPSTPPRPVSPGGDALDGGMSGAAGEGIRFQDAAGAGGIGGMGGMPTLPTEAVLHGFGETADGPSAYFHVPSRNRMVAVALGQYIQLPDGTTVQLLQFENDYLDVRHGSERVRLQLGDALSGFKRLETATVEAILRTREGAELILRLGDQRRLRLQQGHSFTLGAEQWKVDRLAGSMAALSSGERRITVGLGATFSAGAEQSPAVQSAASSPASNVPKATASPLTAAPRATPVGQPGPEATRSAAAPRATPDSQPGSDATRPAAAPPAPTDGQPNATRSAAAPWATPDGATAPGATPVAERRAALRYAGESFEKWRDKWRNELKSELRVEALEALTAFGVNGYPEEAAATILEVMKQYEQPADLGHLSKSDLAVVTQARDGLFQIGPAALPVLSAGLDGDVRVRRFVSMILSGADNAAAYHQRGPAWPYEKPVTALEAATRDGDALVRARAAYALAEEVDPAARAALHEATTDSSPLVRAAAVWAFAQGHAGPEVARVLVDAVNDPQPMVRESAGVSLPPSITAEYHMGGMMEEAMGSGAAPLSVMETMAGMGEGMGGMMGGPRASGYAIDSRLRQRLAKLPSDPQAMARELVKMLDSTDPNLHETAERLLLTLGEAARAALEEANSPGSQQLRHRLLERLDRRRKQRGEEAAEPEPAAESSSGDANAANDDPFTDSGAAPDANPFGGSSGGSSSGGDPFNGS